MLPGKTLNLDEIVQIAKRRVWYLLLFPAVGLFGALIYSSTLKDLYQADVLIAIDPQRVPDAFVRSTVTLAADQRLNSISVQVMSRSGLEEIIQSLNLYPTERTQRPLEEVVEMMRKQIAVSIERPRAQGGGGPPAPTAFHVMFTHTDPRVAADVAQRLGGRFVELNSSDRSKLAKSTNTFLETQLADARRVLEELEQRLEVFRQRHGKELPTRMTTNMQALSNAQMQVQSLVESLARDRDRKLVLDRLHRDAQAEPPAPALVVTASDSQSAALASATAVQRLAAAKAALSGLEARYTADHPDVVRARRQVADLEPLAAAEGVAAASNLPPSGRPAPPADPVRRERLRQMATELESLDRQIAFRESEESRVRSEISEYQRRIEAVPGLESDWVALTRDYDTQQTAYKELLVKASAAQVAADLEQQEIAERFRIVDAATVPTKPLQSLRLRFNGMGLALGLLIGLAAAAFLELRNSSFRSPDEVLQFLALPVLVSIPYVETANERAAGQKRRLLMVAVGGVSVACVAYVTWSLKLWKSLM